MSSTYKVLTVKDLESNFSDQHRFAIDVLNGLSKRPKKLSSKYFYDAEGSRLFEEITQLPEYYLTNCEFEILDTQKENIAELISGKPFNLVELGSGDGRKTNVLLEYFVKKSFEFEYVPIDISETSIKKQVYSLNGNLPQLKTRGLVAEYFDGLKWLGKFTGRKNLVLFLGSNIGNFNQNEAMDFLRGLWNALNRGDYLLIGFDLKKDINLLLKAYNDSQGITADFNLNLLKRINRELGGNFDLNQFRFYSTYNPVSGAVESSLISLKNQTVYIEGIHESFSFESWEPIHTEFSFKYMESEIEELAVNTGFNIKKQLYDSRHHFLDSVWQVKKNSL